MFTSLQIWVIHFAHDVWVLGCRLAMIHHALFLLGVYHGDRRNEGSHNSSLPRRSYSIWKLAGTFTRHLMPSSSHYSFRFFFVM